MFAAKSDYHQRLSNSMPFHLTSTQLTMPLAERTSKNPGSAVLYGCRKRQRWWTLHLPGRLWRGNKRSFWNQPKKERHHKGNKETIGGKHTLPNAGKTCSLNYKNYATFSYHTFTNGVASHSVAFLMPNWTRKSCKRLLPWIGGQVNSMEFQARYLSFLDPDSVF